MHVKAVDPHFHRGLHIGQGVVDKQRMRRIEAAVRDQLLINRLFRLDQMAGVGNHAAVKQLAEAIRKFFAHPLIALARVVAQQIEPLARPAAALRGVEKSEARKRIQYWAKRLEVEEYLYPGATAGALLGQQTTSPFGVRAKRVKPKKADQLSKGNQQKIQLMAALLSDPELLILDEPLSGLDPVNTDLFKKIIREQIAKGKYLIMSSHQMPTVEEFCSDILIMDRSKTVLQGNLNEIKKQLGRVKLYLKTEQPADQIIDDVGVTVEDQKENENEYNLRVQGQAQANALLHALMDGGISVISFTLREPSLHEIFVAKVGGAQ